MRTVITRILMAVIAIGVAGCVTTGQTAPSGDLAAAEVEGVEHARLAATLKGDVDAVEKFIAGDFIATRPNGTVANRAEYLDGMRSGRRRLTSADHDDVRVRVYGDAAVITGRARGKLMVDGKEQAFLTRYIHVYVKEHGQWRMVAMQNTNLAAPPASALPPGITIKFPCTFELTDLPVKFEVVRSVLDTQAGVFAPYHHHGGNVYITVLAGKLLQYRLQFVLAKPFKESDVLREVAQALKQSEGA